MENESIKEPASHRTVWLLAVYAIAMALLEAVVVIYMRKLYCAENPLELFPLGFLDRYDPLVEIAREAATILMIVAVALLAERGSWTRQFAAFVFVFGFWDVLYYVWLKVLMDWPQTWFEWDVLFLIPSVWLGPWICPAAIGAMFTVWGAYVLTTPRRIQLRGTPLAAFVTGSVLGLITFMQPAETVRFSGESLMGYSPGGFWWWLFIPAYGLMAWGLMSSVAMSSRSIVTTKVPA